MKIVLDVLDIPATEASLDLCLEAFSHDSGSWERTGGGENRTYLTTEEKALSDGWFEALGLPLKCDMTLDEFRAAIKECKLE